jgi:nitroreductase
MFDLDQTIKDRHSTRKFLSQPVPRVLLDEALALAQLAPSNSNTQPWRMIIDTCIQVSLAAYPEIIRNELNIPPELLIICGLAVGYFEPDFPTNHLHISRDPVEKNVLFLNK